MDKASVLGDAIKHMKQLQEKVKVLEEQTKKRSVIESLVYVKKYEVCGDGESNPIVTEPLPEIQARFLNKDILIIIHCEKRRGVVERAVAQIGELRLSIVNCSVMTFGDSALNITVHAQVLYIFTYDCKASQIDSFFSLFFFFLKPSQIDSLNFVFMAEG